ncbi:axonemal dynein light intermediate polypeptide 1-like isoform X2 [Syngnathus acus]|uniref:axonemal dynein light intermediate polypeptide 1-like isoform X2 n=1 Tax=Syngnathus acus TaxID=161584 RepID=UPI001885BED2|nr:axonemal dynein light intermediate polypeptide 1-like isoform X2 [Syngnathus acus]
MVTSYFFYSFRSYPDRKKWTPGDSCHNDKKTSTRTFFFFYLKPTCSWSLYFNWKKNHPNISYKMSEFTESLLKYDTPVSISKGTVRKSVKGRPFKVSPHQPADTPVPPPPQSKSGSPENEQVLNVIFPPREWAEGNAMWAQRVSSTPSTRADVVKLEEALDRKLQQRRALETGICPIRRDLYSQCFGNYEWWQFDDAAGMKAVTAGLFFSLFRDELIRQVSINCVERGLLLLRVRDEIQTTVAAYQTLYESSVVFGMRKALQAEQDKEDMRKRMNDLEKEKEELTMRLNAQNAQCVANEKREEEKREAQEKKHVEQIQFWKKTNQQLKAQLEGIVTPKK